MNHISPNTIDVMQSHPPTVQDAFRTIPACIMGPDIHLSNTWQDNTRFPQQEVGIAHIRRFKKCAASEPLTCIWGSPAQHGDMLSQVMCTPPPGRYLKMRWGDWETGRWGLLSWTECSQLAGLIHTTGKSFLNIVSVCAAVFWNCCHDMSNCPTSKTQISVLGLIGSG